jgi:alpha-N-arabinofuranosidase
MSTLTINPDRILAERDIMIYGHFLEHFHRQIYGGVYEPGSPLSDGHGFRADVLEAMRKIKTPIIRWPGGCFVSSYDWKAGVGPNREPVYDKAWRVEEPKHSAPTSFTSCVGCWARRCTSAPTRAPVPPSP